MARLDSIFLLPTSMLVLVLQAAASASERSPTAVRKLAPDANEKIFPEHLAFASLTFGEAAVAAHDFLDAQDAAVAAALDLSNLLSASSRPYRPAFARHYDDSEAGVLRRAAQALALLERRAACPAGMSGCDAAGQPNKCCQSGTVCTKVDDSSVGGIACCPQGLSCSGVVGACPSDAMSCPAELGGGCCIPGYVCQGMGCVPSASATPEATTSTAVVVATSTRSGTQATITSTRTTWVDGTPSAVTVTEIVTVTSSPAPTTKTTTKTVAATGAGTVTGGAPWRPTGTSTTESSSSSETDTSTQAGCPTGFYGCLATHGGGCCQTDRDCRTHSCPPQASTTIVSGGETVVVPATDVPAAATSTCASGWFLCGSDAGEIAGCCPSGYDCGTASCFAAASASQTGPVQKEQPKKEGGGASANSAGLVMPLIAAVVPVVLNMLS